MKSISKRQLFLKHIGQTSPSPMMVEVEKAEGIYMYDPSGKSYIDLISGIAVSQLGHSHPKVVQAVKKQLDKYMHLMVYGEFVQTPQVELGAELASLLPDKLCTSFFVNSGSEAVEAAMKLAKRVTGRPEIISCFNAYHGSSHGAWSLLSDEDQKRPFRPLVPGIRHIRFNHLDDLKFITNQTACVFIEPVQGEAGIRPAEKNFILALREKCTRENCLLIFDEIQTGFGRTGKMFAFEHYNCVPDVILFAKAFGGGLPLGAVVSSKEILDSFTENPVLGHISTFGGHPVSCSASLACVQELKNNPALIRDIPKKNKLFRDKLVHTHIKEIRHAGLMMAVELGESEKVHKAIALLTEKGLITDWFLFCDTALRIAPPLIITEEEIIKSCDIILSVLDEI